MLLQIELKRGIPNDLTSLASHVSNTTSNILPDSTEEEEWTEASIVHRSSWRGCAYVSNIYD